MIRRVLFVLLSISFVLYSPAALPSLSHRVSLFSLPLLPSVCCPLAVIVMIYLRAFVP